MMRGLLSYLCPKRKCRHTWQASFVDVIRDADCPRCGTKGLSPVDVEDLSYERTAGELA